MTRRLLKLNIVQNVITTTNIIFVDEGVIGVYGIAIVFHVKETH